MMWWSLLIGVWLGVAAGVIAGATVGLPTRAGLVKFDLGFTDSDGERQVVPGWFLVLGAAAWPLLLVASAFKEPDGG